MNPRTGTANDTYKTDPTALGIRVHNLVVSKDSGTDYTEFRVQCEMRIPDAQIEDSKAVIEKLTKPTPTSIRELKPIVTRYIDGLATEGFKTAVHLAFEDFTDWLAKQPPKP